MAKYSVVIPLYNKEKDIASTLKSVLSQSLQDFEVIVVNDGSTDKSENVVRSIEDDRIKLFSKSNSGVALTRNYGVQKASTEHIVFLDADDVWLSHHLETIDSLVNQFPDVSWYATAYEIVHNKNLTITMSSPIMNNPKGWTGIVNNYFENSLIDCIAWTSAVCMKKEFFNALNGFDHTITHGAGEDTDLWLRAALKEPLAFSTVISAQYNLSGTNRISNTPTLKRNYMDPDNYEKETISNPYLKEYLDLNRYSFAIQHKLANDKVSFKKYAKNIDLKNLNGKQKFLLKLPRFALKLALYFKAIMESLGVRLTSFGTLKR